MGTLVFDMTDPMMIASRSVQFPDCELKKETERSHKASIRQGSQNNHLMKQQASELPGNQQRLRA
jgi:hypothetical protein